MRRGIGHLLAATTIAVALLPDTAAAVTDPASLVPRHLRVAGGEDVWHADNSFRLDWDRPQMDGHDIAIRIAHLRVRESSGQAAPLEAEFPGDPPQIEHIHVPAGPGRYTAEVWLESVDGGVGPAASAALLFDDVRPGPARPLPPARWIAGADDAVIELEHPPAPQPISGIRGYAISVEQGPGSTPCAGPSRCSEAETDLRDGVAGDRISLGLLPEGANVVSVVAVSGSGMRSAETGSAIVHVDATRPEVKLEGAPRGWASGPVRLTARATDGLSGMAAAGPGGPFTAIAIDASVPRLEAGDSATANVTGEGLHTIALYVRDGAGNVEESPAVATVRIDESPPRVAFARSQDPAEPERLEAVVTDSLSGPDPLRGSIAVRPLGSRQPFASLPTAVAGDRLVAHWDSDASPRGTYEFRATAYDAAGNTAATERRANGTRMVLGNPLKKPTELQAGFGGTRLVWQRCVRRASQRRCHREQIESFERRPTSRTVPYGHGGSYSGRLTSASGEPLGGLPIQVVESFDAGASSSRRTTIVQTAADGGFQTRLGPGPSRRIEAIFAGSQTLTRVSGGEVRLLIMSGVRMRASSSAARVGGAPVVFSGRVGDLGAPIPAAGRAVELQFRLSGSEWSEFRTIRTDAHGHFRYAYSFSDDDSRGVRFQFRAFAPAEDAWPYEPSASRPVFVTGR